MTTSYHQEEKIFTTRGRNHLPPTDTCRAIDELRLPWPMTRAIWRVNPIFRRAPTSLQAARGECGNVNHCAIDVLEDVIGWYRIQRTQDEGTGQVVSESRLFSGHELQKGYQAWANDLGHSKRQVQEAVALLHDAGLVHRHCETITDTYGVNVGNAVFVAPCPDKIREISRPKITDPPGPYIRERTISNKGMLSHTDEIASPPVRETLKSLKSSSKPQVKSHHHAESAPAAEPQAKIDVDADFALSLKMLLAQKVTRKRAESIAKAHPLALIQRQIALLPQRKIDRSRTGTLIASIQDDWPAPALAETSAKPAIAPVTVDDSAAEHKAAIKNYLAGLSADEMAALDQEALDGTKKDFRKSKTAVQSTKLRLVQDRLAKLDEEIMRPSSNRPQPTQENPIPRSIVSK